jgi:hypothetical protein
MVSCFRRHRIAFTLIFLLLYLAPPVHAMEGVGENHQQILSVLEGAGEEVAKSRSNIMTLLGEAFPNALISDKQLEYQLNVLFRGGRIRKNKEGGRKWVFVQNGGTSNTPGSTGGCVCSRMLLLSHLY